MGEKTNVVLKVLFTLVLLGIAVISFGPLAAGVGSYNSDNESKLQNKLTQKSKQIAGVWGTLKIMSGVISILQSTEVGVGAVVVTGSVNPLEGLAVVDNLLDKMSDICLYAIGALLAEKFLLAISDWAALQIVIPVCAVLCVISLWIGKYKSNIKKVLVCFGLIGFSICIAVPVSMQLSYLVEQRIFTGEVEKTVKGIDSQKNQAVDLQEGVEDQKLNPKKIIDSITGFFSNAKNLADSLVSDVLNYIMIFVVTNIIFPIITIAGIFFLVRYLLNMLVVSGT